MILDNHLDVPAAPDAVFSLLNDVERVAGCLPGATLEGRDGEAYKGRVKVKVGPISAAYAGTLRFTEVVPEERTLRMSARASDAHGAGDAEADVVLSVAEAAGGSTLDLHTDLLIRGKIAQFGKGAITTVSGRLLDQFARNLAAELASTDAAPAPGDASVASTPASDSRKSPTSPAPATPDSGEALDGLAMLLPPNAGRWAALAGVAAVGVFQGYLLGRLRGQKDLIRELRRGR
ncbi:SRPBCC family protein [Actinomycetospora straminea]|uniref:Carbon monoxide dehydrogenase subunit G n=1 Tax=Actinomycetospora straminea TaxID=663607 RepID=A0ABP9FCH4_9PSEU|nr:SRPBCC family protein [Actinomycetospora straminea]MDD7936215.1 SRPBCC family protein [Actinomycetospora straminea]